MTTPNLIISCKRFLQIRVASKEIQFLLSNTVMLYKRQKVYFFDVRWRTRTLRVKIAPIRNPGSCDLGTGSLRAHRYFNSFRAMRAKAIP